VTVVIPDRVFFRIGDVSKILGLKTHVIRFWEGEFPFLAPEKGVSGHRVYRKSQIESLVLVKHLLHVERYSIEGAKKKITELRKSGKYKETLNRLMSAGAHPQNMAVGSFVEKERIAALEAKVKELQRLIREPRIAGLNVPGLKVFH